MYSPCAWLTGQHLKSRPKSNVHSSFTTVRGDILTIGGRREAGRFTDITLTGPVCCVFAGEIDLRVRHSGIRKENGE